MEKNFVLNGNKLIAEFMNWKWDMEIKGELCVLDNSFEKIVDKSYYHKSWDWLMPVVEKIENLGVSTNIHYFAGIKAQSLGIDSYGTTMLGYKNTISTYDSSNHFKSKIEAVYNAVIEFIKWHNGQK